MILDHIGELPEVREWQDFTVPEREFPNTMGEAAVFTMQTADAALAAADCEVGRLKCCGNCGHHEYWGDGEDCKAVNGAVLVACFDPCHFTPSRWKGQES